jgi:CheY-like chemotaxis protein
MPISREFVRMMGGDLTVSSEVGKGTCFQFDVPIEVVDAAEVQTAQPSRRVVGLEPGQPIYRLLIAEDVEASRKLLVKLLQPFTDPTGSQGFEVREAVNGQEAIDVWEDWEPHLIWMDIRMPVLDGHEATRRIKATSQGRNTIIIALTAGVFEEERAKTLAEGCDDFVRKPFREHDIFDTLTRHLGVRFTYEDVSELPSQQIGKSGEETIELNIANLESEWLVNMRQATLEGDVDWMAALIRQIQGANPTLAERLTKLAYSFEHGRILSLIQRLTENEQEKSNG